jgi:hypothetical protein
MKYYAGIGSRDTKEPHLSQMRELASRLARKGYVLRSGGAIGADLAFEEGCDLAKGHKEIFLADYPSSKEAWELAEKFHPNWPAVLRKKAGNIMARNGHQVLGSNLDEPVSFIVCWTEGGKLKGGTAQALRIATAYNIPIFNLGSLTIEEVNERIQDLTWADTLCEGP